MKEFDNSSFLLTEKNEKVKAANPWLRISFEMLWKLNLSRKIISCGTSNPPNKMAGRQKFPFNAFLIHSFNAKYLRPEQ